MMRIIAQLVLVLSCLAVAACGSPPPPPGPVHVTTRSDVAPPPVISTAVPVVVSKANSNAGRADPFVVLYGAASLPRQTRVAGNRFPRIPTLPGFEGAPNGGKPASVWDGVRLSGIVQANGFSAIIEANGKSYVAREGDSIAGKFRVVAIGPGYVTLSSAEGVRNFSLGG